MLYPLGLQPKYVPMLRDYGHIPSLNEQETAHMVQAAHHAQYMAWFNSLVAFVLHSPLHWLLSGSTLLITLCGRTTGRTLTLPINYVRGYDGYFYATSRREHKWWHNLGNGAAVTLRLEGQDQAAYARVFKDPQIVTTYFEQILDCTPDKARALGISPSIKGKLFPSDLTRAARQRVLVRLELM